MVRDPTRTPALVTPTLLNTGFLWRKVGVGGQFHCEALSSHFGIVIADDFEFLASIMIHFQEYETMRRIAICIEEKI